MPPPREGFVQGSSEARSLRTGPVLSCRALSPTHPCSPPPHVPSVPACRCPTPSQAHGAFLWYQLRTQHTQHVTHGTMGTPPPVSFLPKVKHKGFDESMFPEAWLLGSCWGKSWGSSLPPPSPPPHPPPPGPWAGCRTLTAVAPAISSRPRQAAAQTSRAPALQLLPLWPSLKWPPWGDLGLVHIPFLQ